MIFKSFWRLERMSNKRNTAASATLTMLKPSQISQALTMINNGIERVTAFIWGEPGIGKSSVVKTWAKSIGYDFLDVRLSSYDNTDISGFPYLIDTIDNDKTNELLKQAVVDAKAAFSKLTTAEVDAKFTELGLSGDDAAKAVQEQMIEDAKLNVKPVFARDMKFTAPHRFPTDPNAKVVILLDEMNGAEAQVLLAVYQLILDRQVGEYKLPENVILIAAGNNDADKGVTFRMPTPISNRMIHLNMRHDMEDWFNFAISQNYSPELVGFIKNAPDMLHQFKADSASKGFATPRSWGFVDSTIRGFHERKEPIPVQDIVFQGVLAGAVGETAFNSFRSHLTLVNSLPPLEQIFSGKAPKRDMRSEVALSYSLTTSGLYRLKDIDRSRLEAIAKSKASGNPADAKHADEYNKSYCLFFDNFFQYLEDNCSAESVLMGFRLALQTYRLYIDATPNGLMPKAKVIIDKYGPKIRQISAMK